MLKLLSLEVQLRTIFKDPNESPIYPVLLRCGWYTALSCLWLALNFFSYQYKFLISVLEACVLIENIHRCFDFNFTLYILYLKKEKRKGIYLSYAVSVDFVILQNQATETS